jgi:hypothetical protein
MEEPKVKELADSYLQKTAAKLKKLAGGYCIRVTKREEDEYDVLQMDCKEAISRETLEEWKKASSISVVPCDKRTDVYSYKLFINKDQLHMMINGDNVTVTKMVGVFILFVAVFAGFYMKRFGCYLCHWT